MNEYFPVRFAVADAQSLIVKAAIEKDFEWLLLIEDDVIPPPDRFLKMDQYMRKGPPVVSGLYFLNAEPAEPLVYRGRGNGAFWDWKAGDKVWCDGVRTGCPLIHCSILREMWTDASEYNVYGQITRNVFSTPTRMWVNPEAGDVNTIGGTSDLDRCSKIMEGDYLRKAGWEEFADRKYPFLIDTSILCRHIAPDGTVYPRWNYVRHYL